MSEVSPEYVTRRARLTRVSRAISRTFVILGIALCIGGVSYVLTKSPGLVAPLNYGVGGLALVGVAWIVTTRRVDVLNRNERRRLDAANKEA